jgi:hypothetical protein
VDERIYRDFIEGLWILGIVVLMPTIVHFAATLFDRYLPQEKKHEG